MRARPGIDRLIDLVVLDENGCWLFSGAKMDGYGRLHLNKTVDGARRNVLCHRFAYEHFRGPIESGYQLDHLCRVRHCVNPWHLEVVTSRENILRGEAPHAVLHRLDVCKRGHDLQEHGEKNGTRRRCRICTKRARERRARRREETAAAKGAGS